MMSCVQIADEIVSVLASDPNANIRLTIEISADFSEWCGRFREAGRFRECAQSWNENSGLGVIGNGLRAGRAISYAVVEQEGCPPGASLSCSSVHFTPAPSRTNAPMDGAGQTRPIVSVSGSARQQRACPETCLYGLPKATTAPTCGRISMGRGTRQRVMESYS
jgi:hypothetical protein